MSLLRHIVNYTKAGIELFTNTNAGYVRVPAGESVDVNIQDQHTPVVDLNLHSEIQEVTISTNTTIHEYTVTIDAPAPLTVGNSMCFKEGISFYQAVVLSIADNGGGNYTLTMDTPLDFAFTTAASVCESIINMNVDGSGTPVVFKISPKYLDSGTEWDITRFLGSITDQTVMDDAKFGGLPALTRGIVFRTINGVTKNIFNSKSNGDLKSHMYDVDYSTKAPAGYYGLTFRRTLAGTNKNGVTLRLCADTLDTFEIIIQDDLTLLDTFVVVAQGHVVD